MLKGLSGRVLRDRRILGFSRRWNTPHLPSEVPAAYHGHNETVRNLAGLSEVDVNHADEKGMTALHWEAKKGCPTQVLIDAGADIEARNSLGRSPLLVACENGNISEVKMLVEAGAGVRATDNEGDTCLILATHCGCTETVRYLAGLPEVDVNHKGRNGTALHNAVDEGSPDVVQVLINAGADIEAKDEKGRSPLHCASSSGALPVVKMLVEAGAGVRATDNEGATCLTLAGANGHTDVVRYLAGLPEVDVKQTDRLGNTALEAVPEQGNATKEEVKALKEMMKSVMDQQKEMLEVQKVVLGPIAEVIEAGPPKWALFVLQFITCMIWIMVFKIVLFM